MNVSVLRLNRGFLIYRCSCAARKTLNALTSVSRRKPKSDQNLNAAPPLSKLEDYHRVNTFFTSLDKILPEIESQFSGNHL